MKITTTLRLEPPPEDRQRLVSRFRVFNEACNWLSEIAFEEKLWNWLTLQHRAYRELRTRLGVKSHAALVCIRKVAYAYRNKRRRGTRAVFRPLGAVPLYRHRYKRDGTLAFYGFRIPFTARLGRRAVLRLRGAAHLGRANSSSGRSLTLLSLQRGQRAITWASILESSICP